VLAMMVGTTRAHGRRGEDVAQAAYEAIVAKYPGKRIRLRQVCRVIRRSDEQR
jgi:hypothetical protein